MVELNESSAEILQLCDGSRNVGQIVAELEEMFSATDLKDDIHSFLEAALKNGWIEQP